MSANNHDPRAAQPTEQCFCTNGIVRSLGRDNDEVIEDCPVCVPTEQDGEPTDGQLLDHLESLFSKTNNRSPAWKSLLNNAAVYGFRKAIKQAMRGGNEGAR